jgi:hypothetical protein
MPVERSPSILAIAAAEGSGLRTRRAECDPARQQGHAEPEASPKLSESHAQIKPCGTCIGNDPGGGSTPNGGGNAADGERPRGTSVHA